MTTSTWRSRPIVVGVDGSAPARHALRWAAPEAVRRRVPLRLVHADLPISGGASDDVRERLREAADAARVVAPEVELDIHTQIGEPSGVLLRESENAQLVALGCRGLGGFRGLLLGSTAIALASHGRCPVVLLREPPRHHGPVVVEVIDSPLGVPVLGQAFDQASVRGTSLITVRVWHSLGGDEDLAEAMGIDWADLRAEQNRLVERRIADWCAKYPDVPVQRVIARGRPTRRMIDYCGIAQLVVVGCRGRAEVTGVLSGATCGALLRHAHCAVLVVHVGEA